MKRAYVSVSPFARANIIFDAEAFLFLEHKNVSATNIFYVRETKMFLIFLKKHFVLQQMFPRLSAEKTMLTRFCGRLGYSKFATLETSRGLGPNTKYNGNQLITKKWSMARKSMYVRISRLAKFENV